MGIISIFSQGNWLSVSERHNCRVPPMWIESCKAYWYINSDAIWSGVHVLLVFRKEISKRNREKFHFVVAGFAKTKTARISRADNTCLRQVTQGLTPLQRIDKDEPARTGSDAVSHIDSGAVDAGQSPSWQAWRTDSRDFKTKVCVRNRFVFQIGMSQSVCCAHIPWLYFHCLWSHTLSEAWAHVQKCSAA